jgi:hypothetical protein
MAITLDGTNGINSSGVIVAPDGSASAPAITNDGDTNTGIFFPAADTIAFAEGGAEAMRIDSSGNVLIGTSTARTNLVTANSSKFQIEGTSFDTSTASVIRNSNDGGAPAFIFGKSRGTTVGSNTVVQNGDACGAVIFSGSDGTNFVAAAQINGIVDGTPSAGNVPGRLTFVTSQTERARIDSGGDVLIGQTSQSFSGNGRLSVLGSNTAYAASIGSPSNGGTYFYVDLRTSAGVQTGAILSGNGTNTSYNTSSDYRLKENIAPMTGALATVAKLKPCTYTWKADGSAGQGFIAHELQEVVPDCVTGEKDAVETYTDEEGNEQTRIKPQGIDTSFLVATLTAAIQELSAKNDALEARIAALEGSQT